MSRIVDGSLNWRILYHIALDAIVILDVFAKKTAATPKSVIAECHKRLAEFHRVLNARKERAVRADKRRKLERAGWTVGDAGDFLGLSADERRFVEVKLALADGLRRRREQLGLTQIQVAERFGSSQSRVAKMEAADRTVTTDLLLKSLFRLGASPRDVARLLILKARNRAA